MLWKSSQRRTMQAFLLSIRLYQNFSPRDGHYGRFCVICEELAFCSQCHRRCKCCRSGCIVWWWSWLLLERSYPQRVPRCCAILLLLHAQPLRRLELCVYWKRHQGYTFRWWQEYQTNSQLVHGRWHSEQGRLEAGMARGQTLRSQIPCLFITLACPKVLCNYTYSQGFGGHLESSLSCGWAW